MKILTFDIEDWFHILDFDETENLDTWNKYNSRLNIGIDFIFKSLSDSGYRATFFVLGWIADQHPKIVKRIIEEGYEIGNHSYSHLLLYKHGFDYVKKDLEYSTKILQDITGAKIKYFRAPGFSIKNDTNWVFDILLALGIEVDSSIFPTSRGHGGYSGFPYSSPCRIKVNGSFIKELPINTYKFINKEIVFSGGGYFRLLPNTIQKMLYNKSDYLITYFHPRDFDADQPVLVNLSSIRRFKSYVGLKTSQKKFQKLLKEFKFIDLQDAVNLINWEETPIVEL